MVAVLIDSIRWFYLAPLLALLAGSLVYCVLAMVAANRYRRSGAPVPRHFPVVSILRPMAGAWDNTEANLRSVFAQQYPAPFEVLLSVHEETDPAVAIARRVMAEYPDIPSQLVVAGASPEPNAKVWSLRALLREAKHPHLLMSDSDIHLKPDCLRVVMTELSQLDVALVTCPYRASGGPNFWPRIESIGLNIDFLAGMLTQRMLNGMDFAIGCTIATRRGELEAIGGMEHLQRYLAEDFMMGNLMQRRGRQIVLSRSVVEHHIGNDTFLKNWTHRMRWARSTRRSRPMGYLGEIFMKPTAIAMLLCLFAPGAWGLVIVAYLFRAGVVWSTAVEILEDPLIERWWWLLPVEDVSSLVTWILGFFGKSITWRGRRLIVQRDGSVISSALQ